MVGEVVVVDTTIEEIVIVLAPVIVSEVIIALVIYVYYVKAAVAGAWAAGVGRGAAWRRSYSLCS